MIKKKKKQYAYYPLSCELTDAESAQLLLPAELESDFECHPAMFVEPALTWDTS